MPGSVFDPRSPGSLAIANLFVITLVMGLVILTLVTALVLWSAYRYRARGEDGEPRQRAGIRRLEIGWTVGAFLIILVVFVLTVRTMQAADPGVEGQPADDVVITGYQWWWAVRYPQAGVVTANEIHLPAGQRVLARLESADVIHDFWVPQLGRKLDMTPGEPAHLWLQADTPGVYLGACAEYCGAEHAWMRLRVVVQPPAEFDAWLRQQAQPAPNPTGGDAARGAQLFQTMTCASCHAIAGTPAQARVGPDLTHLASRTTLASGVLDNTPDNLRRWLANPQAIKPGTYMPDTQLSDADVRALAAYLETLK